MDVEPGSDLRVSAIQAQRGFGDEHVPFTVGSVELGLIAVRERPDQSADAVRIAEGKCRMAGQRLHTGKRRALRNERLQIVDHRARCVRSCPLQRDLTEV